MGLKWNRLDVDFIQSSDHCRCGSETICDNLTGKISRNDMLFVVENDVASDDVDRAINDLLEGTGVSLASQEVEYALA